MGTGIQRNIHVRRKAVSITIILSSRFLLNIAFLYNTFQCKNVIYNFDFKNSVTVGIFVLPDIFVGFSFVDVVLK